MLTTLQDLIYEGGENFSVILSSPSANATLTDSTGVVTITDDESAPQISVNDIGISE